VSSRSAQEFKTELDARAGQLDADPHFWMPVTLPQSAYVAVMQGKGMDGAEARAHWARMQALKARVLPLSPPLRFFGAVPTGQEMHWWDYGRLELYKSNNVLITQGGPSAVALRHFLGAVPRVQASEVSTVNLSTGACVLNCAFRGGFIGQNAVLVNVKAPYVDVDDCVLVNVSSLRPILGRGGVLYNVVDDETSGTLSCDHGAVRADVFVPERVNALPRLGTVGGRHLQLHSSMDTDGGKAWKVKLPQNELSFEQMHELNKGVEVAVAQETAAREHGRIAQLIVQGKAS
jgi:hypothetical protein